MSNQKKMYLLGWEVTFNGDEDCQKFIETHVINQESAYSSGLAIELIFEYDKLVRAFDIREERKIVREGKIKPRELEASEIGFPYQDLQPHQIYLIEKTEKGHSYIGGRPPEDFIIPECGLNAPIQFLGKLSPVDEAFSWLPFELHLMAPIYLGFETFFVDYSDPMRPVVLQLDELRAIENEEDDLNPDYEIYFEQTFFECIKTNDLENRSKIGHVGVPIWLQAPETPSCPKTNGTMKFVCQLSFDNGIKTEYTTVPTDYKYYDSYTDLNFWGDGELYIFFNPESKVACYYIQIT
jgi:hypothetical protein